MDTCITMGRIFNNSLCINKLQLTPYMVAPLVYINFLNFIQSGIGYNIRYRRIDNFNMSGFLFSVNINIGTSNHYFNLYD